MTGAPSGAVTDVPPCGGTHPGGTHAGGLLRGAYAARVGLGDLARAAVRGVAFRGPVGVEAGGLGLGAGRRAL